MALASGLLGCPVASLSSGEMQLSRDDPTPQVPCLNQACPTGGAILGADKGPEEEPDLESPPVPLP